MMNTPRRASNRLAYILLGFASLTYIILTITAPLISSNIYRLPTSMTRLLQLTIILPVIGVWFTALWGSLQFKNYARSIVASSDGRALYGVANGLLWLVWGLVVTGLIQSLRPWALGWANPGVWVMLNYYTGLLFFIISFVLLFSGARQLASMVHFKDYFRWHIIALVAVTILGVAYAWPVAFNQYRSSGASGGFLQYALPSWALLLTIVLPYVVAWYLGIMAAAGLRIYHKHADGIIYRQAVSRLSVGLFGVVVASVFIQLLTAVSASLQRLGLGSVLILIYVLIIVYAAGHVLIASGARKLARIEEVQ